MKRNVWTSPFGLAFIIGSLAALVAGYFTGAGMSGSATNSAIANYNIAADNLTEPYPDENALIAANREPSAPAPVPQAAPPPVAAPVAAPTPAPETEEVIAPDDEPAVVDRPRARDRRDRRAEPPPEDAPEENPDAPR